MKSLSKTSLTVLAICVFASTAHADIVFLSGPMDVFQSFNNGNSYDDGAGDGNGAISGTYDDATNMLQYTLTWQDLSASANNINFHNAPPRSGGPITLAVPTPYTSPLTSSAVLSESQETELLAGNWFVNVSTGSFPNGEIRGQVLVSAVPEPGTTALGLLAIAGLALRRRRQTSQLRITAHESCLPV